MTPNPLATLCRQLGLSPAAAAKLAGCSLEDAAEALADVPAGAVRAFCGILAGIQAKVRVAAADTRLAFWVERDALDAVYRDDAFRRANGLLGLPRTLGELRVLMAQLKGPDASFADVSGRLEASFIPTATGLREWRRTTVAQHLASRGARDADPMPEPGAELRRAWRSWAVDMILADLSPVAGDALRYGIVPTWVHRGDEGERVTFRATRPMPACAVRWCHEGLVRMAWLGGRWGLCEPAEQAETVAADELEADQGPAGAG